MAYIGPWEEDCAPECRERTNCGSDGAGHHSCGFCTVHDIPTHHCGGPHKADPFCDHDWAAGYPDGAPYCAKCGVPQPEEEPMPEWEQELLHGTPEQALAFKIRHYEEAVTDLRDLIQRHLNDHCSKPALFRSRLERQAERVRYLEDVMNDQRSVVANNPRTS